MPRVTIEERDGQEERADAAAGRGENGALRQKRPLSGPGTGRPAPGRRRVPGGAPYGGWPYWGAGVLRAWPYWGGGRIGRWSAGPPVLGRRAVLRSRGGGGGWKRPPAARTARRNGRRRRRTGRELPWSVAVAAKPTRIRGTEQSNVGAPRPLRDRADTRIGRICHLVDPAATVADVPKSVHAGNESFADQPEPIGTSGRPHTRVRPATRVERFLAEPEQLSDVVRIRSRAAG